MNDVAAIFDKIDRICGQFASALHHSELQVYATIFLLIALSIVLFPPKNDSDQI